MFFFMSKDTAKGIVYFMILLVVLALLLMTMGTIIKIILLIVAFLLFIVAIVGIVKSPAKQRPLLIVGLLLLFGIAAVPFALDFMDEANIAKKNEYILVNGVNDFSSDERYNAYLIDGWLGGNDSKTNLNRNTMNYSYSIKSVIYNGKEYTALDDIERIIEFIERGKMYYFDEYTYNPQLIKYRSGELRLNLDKVYKEGKL